MYVLKEYIKSILKKTTMYQDIYNSYYKYIKK